MCSGRRQRSAVADAEISVTCFRSTAQADGAAKRAYQLGTPGLRSLGTAAGSRGRGVFTQDGRSWTVIGDTLYELTFAPFTATSRGTIIDDGLPVSWASNGDGGSQLAIVGVGQLKIFDLDTNTLSAAIVLPLTRAPRHVGFLDGYFLLSEVDSLITWFSGIENGTLWD